MNNKDIENKVNDIVAEHLSTDVQLLTPNTHFEQDLNADSLDVVELIMTIEEEFDINVPDEDAEKMTIIQHLTQFVQNKKNPIN